MDCDLKGKSGLKQQIREFWTDNPCSKNLIAKETIDKEFFLAHDRIIDRLTPYHYEVYRYESCRGKRVLEIGCGMGSHALRFAKYAKEFYAIDISTLNVELCKKRFELYDIKGAHIQQADAENLPFPDNSFDYVYSNGVIHHTPDTQKAALEIYRVLKPAGSATVMLYHKNSIFYWIDLMLLTQAKYIILKLIPKNLVKIIFGRNLSDSKIFKLTETVEKTPWKGLPNLILRFSDGHFNPHTKVYTRKQAEDLFSSFRKKKSELRSPSGRFMEKTPFIEKHLGWALFIFAEK